MDYPLRQHYRPVATRLPRWLMRCLMLVWRWL
jgi:hypothetical protein